MDDKTTDLKLENEVTTNKESKKCRKKARKCKNKRKQALEEENRI